MTDLLEQRLSDALQAARTDDRWALTPPTGTLEAVRRGARRRRQRAAVLTAGACVLAVTGAAGLAGGALVGAPDRVAPYAGPGPAAGEPVPGISPPWAPASGREWLLTAEQWDAFMANHTVPEHDGGQSRVPSPAPPGPVSERLLAEVRPVLPPGTSTAREDAVGGNPDTSAVHVRLPDGTPVEVERYQLTAPMAYDRLGGEDPAASGWWVEDVPGTTTALLLLPDAPYGFGTDGGANGVLVVTRTGSVTFWVAPDTVPVETLRTWATAAAATA